LLVYVSRLLRVKKGERNMKVIRPALAVLVLLTAVMAHAQKTPPITGSGTVGDLLIYTGTNAIGNSLLSQSNGNIVTAAPIVTTNSISSKTLSVSSNASIGGALGVGKAE
jgi:hypothetical protein